MSADFAKMQATQPWNVTYSNAFQQSKGGHWLDGRQTVPPELHRSLTHDILHVTKAVGILSSISEWADHGDVRLDRVDQGEYEARISDLVMCAMHMANNPPRGYSQFDLEAAVIARTERVNDGWPGLREVDES